MVSTEETGVPSVAPPPGLASVSSTVLLPSSTPSNRIGTATVLLVSPWAKTTVVEVAV